MYLLYSFPIIYSKKISISRSLVATLARLRFILHLEMQTCNVLYQPDLYCLFVGVIITDCQLPKFTSVYKNCHLATPSDRRCIAWFPSVSMSFG